jgi:acetate kinase
MTMHQSLVLVINSGSSSVKFSLLPASGGAALFSGMAESLGDAGNPRLSIRIESGKFTEAISGSTHEDALRAIFWHMRCNGWLPQVAAVGHRVVHGGERFAQSVLITPEVMQEIEGVSMLAPLHNAANLLGIHACCELLPLVPQVAVFDTAFHQSMAPAAYTYAIPHRFYGEHSIRRYGFHGTSFRCVAARAVEALGLDPEDHGLVIAHLGNGASACAVDNGQCRDTTMGLTPLEGLVMGTRSGDLDFGAAAQISRLTGLDFSGVEAMLNRESGLLGISGLSNDCRTLEEAVCEGHAGAALAIDVFVHRLARYIGALATSLKRFDAVVFTGGIGENSARVRAMTLQRLGIFGLALDPAANERVVRGVTGRIDCGSGTQAWVIPTDEEGLIARDAARLAGLHEASRLQESAQAGVCEAAD